MNISKLIKSLEEIKNKHGDCEVFYWDVYHLVHNPIEYVIYQTEENFREDLVDCKQYVNDFERTKNNVILI